MDINNFNFLGNPMNLTPPSSVTQRVTSPAMDTQPPHNGSKSYFYTRKWTQEEEQTLIKSKSEGLKWLDIIKKIPNKSYNQCRDHWRNHLAPKQIGKNIDWTPVEIQKLKDLVLPILKKGLKINWKKIAEKIESKTNRQCMNKWDIIKQKLPLSELAKQSLEYNSEESPLAEKIKSTQTQVYSETTQPAPSSLSSVNFTPVPLDIFKAILADNRSPSQLPPYESQINPNSSL